MKYALTLALVLALSLVAQATTVATVGSVSIDVSQDLTTPPSAGLTAYIVTLNSTVGIYSVDGRINATTGSTLNQVFYAGALPTPTIDSPYTLLTSAQKKNDTHLLVSTGSMVTDRAPDEDLAGTTLCGYHNGNTDGNPDDNFNDYTATMAFGFGPGLASYTAIPFARVVLNSTSTAEFKFDISDSNKAKDSFDFIIGGAVPEPMTLSLLGAGALALIRRRR